MNNNPIIMEQSEITALNRFFAKIYGYVALGVGISALVAYLSLTVLWELTYNILMAGSWIIWVMMLAQIGLVMFASGAAAKNSPMALPLFLVYSALNGFTIGIVLLFYTGETVLLAFVTAVGMFAVMAIIGAATKKNLSAMGQALLAALVGVVIASVVNMFLQSSGMSFIISLISVVIFAGLIAYDNQRIRYVFEETGGNVQEGWAISLALQLYLDFVNLFLHLLRVLGRRN